MNTKLRALRSSDIGNRNKDPASEKPLCPLQPIVILIGTIDDQRSPAVQPVGGRVAVPDPQLTAATAAPDAISWHCAAGIGGRTSEHQNKTNA